MLDGDELLVHGASAAEVGELAARGGNRAPRARRGVAHAGEGLPRADRRERAVTAQLRSELRKMATTRTNVGLLLGLVALILFGVIAGSFGSEADLSLGREPAGADRQRLLRRGLRRHDRGHGDDERVPARHDPRDVRLHPRPYARRSGQSACEHPRRYRLRRARRGPRTRQRRGNDPRRAATTC